MVNTEYKNAKSEFRDYDNFPSLDVWQSLTYDQKKTWEDLQKKKKRERQARKSNELLRKKQDALLSKWLNDRKREESRAAKQHVPKDTSRKSNKSKGNTKRKRGSSAKVKLDFGGEDSTQAIKPASQVDNHSDVDADRYPSEDEQLDATDLPYKVCGMPEDIPHTFPAALDGLYPKDDTDHNSISEDVVPITFSQATQALPGILPTLTDYGFHFETRYFHQHPRLGYTPLSKLSANELPHIHRCLKREGKNVHFQSATDRKASTKSPQTYSTAKPYDMDHNHGGMLILTDHEEAFAKDLSNVSYCVPPRVVAWKNDISRKNYPDIINPDTWYPEGDDVYTVGTGWLDPAVIDLVTAMRKSYNICRRSPPRVDLFANCGFLPASRFMQPALDDIELVDFCYQAASFVWYCTELSHSPMLRDAILNAFDRSPSQSIPSKVVDKCHFVGFVSVHRDGERGPIQSFSLQAFAIYESRRKSIAHPSHLHLHSVLCRRELMLSTASERIIQICQLIHAYQGVGSQTEHLPDATLYLENKHLQNIYATIGAQEREKGHPYAKDNDWNYVLTDIIEIPLANMTTTLLKHLPLLLQYTERLPILQEYDMFRLAKELVFSFVTESSYCYPFFLDVPRIVESDIIPLMSKSEDSTMEPGDSDKESIKEKLRLLSRTEIKFKYFFHLIKEYFHERKMRTINPLPIIQPLEFVMELFQDVSLKLVKPIPWKKCFSGDAHLCVLHCDRCNCNFTPELDAVEILLLAPVYVLEHYDCHPCWEGVNDAYTEILSNMQYHEDYVVPHIMSLVPPLFSAMEEWHESRQHKMAQDGKGKPSTTKDPSNNANHPLTANNANHPLTANSDASKLQYLGECTTITEVEMHPTMIAFSVLWVKEDDSSDDEDEYKPVMPNCNHNTIRLKTIAEIANQTYGNPIGVHNSHEASFGDDMQAFAIHCDKVRYI